MELRLDYSLGQAAQDHNGGVTVTKVRDPASNFTFFIYQCSLEEDFDGAPDAYGKNNPNPVAVSVNPPQNLDTAFQVNVEGRDALPNATSNIANSSAQFTDGRVLPARMFHYVGIWSDDQTTANRNGFSIDRRPELEARQRMEWVRRPGTQISDWRLVTRQPGQEGYFPAIQGAGSPARGHYVSTSAAIADPRLNDWDQNKYVNAVEIPYAAWASWWGTLNVSLGDLGLAFARDTGAVSGFVFADSGSGNVGEVSNKLLTTLTRDGGTNENKFNFMVFPGSGRGVAGQFTQEAVIQQKVKELVSRLNSVQNADELLALMAFDMSQTRLRNWAPERDTDSASLERAGRYDTALAALSAFGFSG